MATERPAGARDFDFLLGNWRVQHRRLKKRLANGHEWAEFGGTVSVRPILGGAGNFDENVIDLPEGQYQACTLRYFNDSAGKWFIYWIDGRNPALDPPLQGAFDGGTGTFYGDDTFEGQPICVRFVWSEISEQGATWRQAFSADGGKSWEENWEMKFTRV